jgi:tetratricopeptide (TPR) repeat protein
MAIQHQLFRCVAVFVIFLATDRLAAQSDPDLVAAEREALAGRWESAIRTVESIRDDSAARDDAARRGCALATLARIAQDRSRFFLYDPERADGAVAAAVTFTRTSPSSACHAQALHEQARAVYAKTLAAKERDWSSVGAAVDKAFAARQPDDERGLAHSHFYRGLVAQMEGRFDQAEQELKQSLTLAQRVRDVEIVGSSYRHLAFVAAARERTEEAAFFFARSLDELVRGGLRVVVPFARQANASAGDRARALPELRLAVREAEASRSYRAAATVGLVLAEALESAGDRPAAQAAASRARDAAARYGEPTLAASVDAFIQKTAR